MINAPCKDCKDREYPVCYGRCEAYQTFKQHKKDARSKERTERMVNAFLYRRGQHSNPGMGRKDQYDPWSNSR